MILNKVSFAAIAASLAVCSLVSAATIVDFKPNPVSPTTPEFRFARPPAGGAPEFRGALGSTSNNDGNLPILTQTAPGLDSETPFILAGPGAANDLIAGTTHFYDSQLVFTGGFQANAPAINAGGVLIQQLSPGNFDLVSTTAGGGPVLLLRGNMSAASFVVGVGNAGSVFSSQDVNYTAGVIFNALVAAGGTPNGNSMSISMTDVAPNLNIAGDGFLADFTANATGLFSATSIPEPTSLTLIAMAMGSLFLRRR